MPAPDRVRIAVTGATPVALLTAGLSAVLRHARAELSPAGGSVFAVPIRGQGSDLAALFADLTADLAAQLAEWGAGLDHVALDGLLRTETGGFTAWGYLTGDVTRAAVARGVTVTGVRVDEGEPLALTGELLTTGAP